MRAFWDDIKGLEIAYISSSEPIELPETDRREVSPCFGIIAYGEVYPCEDLDIDVWEL